MATQPADSNFQRKPRGNLQAREQSAESAERLFALEAEATRKEAAIAAARAKAEQREAAREALAQAGLAAQTQQAATLARLQQAQASSIEGQSRREAEAEKEARRLRRRQALGGIFRGLGNLAAGQAKSAAEGGGQAPIIIVRGRKHRTAFGHAPAKRSPKHSNDFDSPLEPFGSASDRAGKPGGGFFSKLEPFGSTIGKRRPKRTDRDPFMEPLEPFGSGFGSRGHKLGKRATL